MTDSKIPRINSSMFREYINKYARVVGQVLSVCIYYRNKKQNKIKIKIKIKFKFKFKFI